jgi:hypothetical protein
VVVDVAGADGLRPAGAGEARVAADLGEVAGTVVFVELGAAGRAVGDEDVVGAIAIEVEDGGAGAGALEDGLFFVDAAEGVGDGEAGRGGDVDEVEGGGLGGGGEGSE